MILCIYRRGICDSIPGFRFPGFDSEPGRIVSHASSKYAKPGSNCGEPTTKGPHKQS